MIVEKQMECRLAGGTQVLGENLPQRHFGPSQNPTWQDPGLNPGRLGGKPATNHLSYDVAQGKWLGWLEALAWDRGRGVLILYLINGIILKDNLVTSTQTWTISI
jgi:hypothetical protein